MRSGPSPSGTSRDGFDKVGEKRPPVKKYDNDVNKP